MSVVWYAILAIVVVTEILARTGVLHRRGSPGLILGYEIILTVASLANLAGLRRNHIVLRDGGIEVVNGLAPARFVARSEIQGRLFHAGGWRRHTYHILVLQDGRRVSLPPYLEHNAHLNAFLAEIPLLTRKLGAP